MPEKTDEATEQLPVDTESTTQLLQGELLLRIEQVEQGLLELMARPDPEPIEAMVAYSAPATPTRGRIVDYHTAAQSYSAIITAAYATGAVDLVVFGSAFGAAALRHSVIPGGPGVNHRWSWPQIVTPEPVEEGDEE